MIIGLSRFVVLALTLAAEPAVGRVVRTALLVEVHGEASGPLHGEARGTTKPAAPAAPTALTVTTATKSSVELSWKSDATSKIVVERKQLGVMWPVATAAAATAAAATPTPTPSTIAIVSGATTADSKIDQYATYVYRVRAQGADNSLSAPSNEVIAGPPPVGISSVIAAPKAMQAHDASQFANQIRLTFDVNNDPSIAYLNRDLNNDGESDDTELAVITWNRARYKWNAPVSVDTVGNVARGGTRMPFAFARDESTGKFGILHITNEHELRLSTSDDGGLTWKHARVDHSGNEEPLFSTPSLAMAAGRVYVAYAIGNGTVQYRAGTAADDPSKWAAKKAPLIAGMNEVRAECVTMRLDAAGKPVVAYCLNGDSYNSIAALWRPDVGTTVKVMDTANHQNDDPGLDMTIAGNQIAVGFFGARDDKFFANHHIWFARSVDNGATFSPAVVVADDGGNAMGAPLSVMVDRAGHNAMLANVDGGNDGDVKCGMPKLMRSADGAKWITCAPDTKGAPANSDPVSPMGGFAGNDKLYIVFRTRQPGTGLVPGLVLWRER